MRRASAALLAFLLADQLLQAALYVRPEGIVLFHGGFVLRGTWNAQGIFSLPVPETVLLGAGMTLACILIVTMIRIAQRGYYLMALGILALLLGGAANMVDRIIYGAVCDYIDLPGPLPIFNLADASILFGVLCVLWAARSTRSVDSTVESR